MSQPGPSTKRNKRKKKQAAAPAQSEPTAGGSAKRGGQGPKNSKKGKGKQVEPQSLASRAAARKIVSDRKQANAEKHYDKATGLFNDGKYEAALKSLQDACVTFKTLPKYVLKMASTFMKLERYEQAIDMATFHIAIDRNQNNISARFLRATAFIREHQYAEAAVDLILCKRSRPEALEVTDAIEQLHQLWDVDKDYFERNPEYANANAVHTIMATCTANYDLDCESDTEDSRHIGNGKPCKNYNKGAPCTSGSKCNFRHAVDDRSVRDQLGRNVCLNFLLHECSKPKCPYAHFKANLPINGWWNKSEYVAYYQSVYHNLGELIPPFLGRDMNGQLLPFQQRETSSAWIDSHHKTEGARHKLRRQLEAQCAFDSIELASTGPFPLRPVTFFPLRRTRRKMANIQLEDSFSEYDDSEFDIDDFRGNRDGMTITDYIKLGYRPWDASEGVDWDSMPYC
ncbi:hypothetical protein MIND_00775300 [Mycena indigotica]|uniref:C3H1-type domain-containing protein n=1 Tax=Mycena indigotica TaxID=2126181 RepID=A0A8H6W408_9AGAR|nr:uncharacterized protein MIND_00775300 [Mycena indigotica]KAF7302086.1 hypothetical protein MIND_00775300 [Mycena indigotica]